MPTILLRFGDLFCMCSNPKLFFIIAGWVLYGIPRYFLWLSHSHLILRCLTKKIFPALVCLNPELLGASPGPFIALYKGLVINQTLYANFLKHICQMMDWPCSKLVQSLGLTAFVVQNKNMEQNNFRLYSEEQFPTKPQKVPYYALSCLSPFMPPMFIWTSKNYFFKVNI